MEDTESSEKYIILSTISSPFGKHGSKLQSFLGGRTAYWVRIHTYLLFSYC